MGVESYYQGAAVCRRGHVQSRSLDPGGAALGRLANNCGECGARVLFACPACRYRIRGDHKIPDLPLIEKYQLPGFCEQCGSAFPWATKVQRIYELENLLDEREIDEADRVVIQDHLARLRAEEITPEQEAASWKAIKQRTGRLLSEGPIARVLEGVMTAAVRAQLGL